MKVLATVVFRPLQSEIAINYPDITEYIFADEVCITRSGLVVCVFYPWKCLEIYQTYQTMLKATFNAHKTVSSMMRETYEKFEEPMLEVLETIQSPQLTCNALDPQKAPKLAYLTLPAKNVWAWANTVEFNVANEFFTYECSILVNKCTVVVHDLTSLTLINCLMDHIIQWFKKVEIPSAYACIKRMEQSNAFISRIIEDVYKIIYARKLNVPLYTPHKTSNPFIDPLQDPFFIAQHAQEIFHA